MLAQAIDAPAHFINEHGQAKSCMATADVEDSHWHRADRGDAAADVIAGVRYADGLK